MGRHQLCERRRAEDGFFVNRIVCRKIPNPQRQSLFHRPVADGCERHTRDVLLAHEAKNIGFEWVRSHRDFLVTVDGAIKADPPRLACYSAGATLNLAVVLRFRAGQLDFVYLYR
jgi:hypothetical protein